MTIYLVALLFATLTLGVSLPRVSLHRWLLFTIRALGKDGEEDLNKLSVNNSNSCRNTVFFVIIIETRRFFAHNSSQGLSFLLFQNKIQFLSRLFGLFKRIFLRGNIFARFELYFFFLAIYRITTIILTSSRSGKTRVLTVMKFS